MDTDAYKTVTKAGVMLLEQADEGAMGAYGPWEPVRTGFTPGHENEFRIKWLKGEAIRIKV